MFGRWTVIRLAYVSQSLGAYWHCLCVCGVQRNVRARSLIQGASISCGCYRLEVNRAKVARYFYKHGHARHGQTSRVYSVWQNMLKRCLNPNNSYFAIYGGRGIAVCDRWMEFENFLLDMGEPPTLKHSLDRIDNDKGYEPTNCRWATQAVQANNTRRNVFLEYRGQRKTVAEWAKESGINYSTLHSRIFDSGWSVEQSLTLPVRMK